ncbi:hypothetical protein WJX77_008464 [Trebouxia sp. C0004]
MCVVQYKLHPTALPARMQLAQCFTAIISLKGCWMASNVILKYETIPLFEGRLHFPEVAAKLKGSATIWRLVPWASWGYIVVFSFQWHAERFTSKRHSGRQVSYFISPQAQNMVQAAVFYVVDDEDNRVGVGVFFSRATRTADHSCSALILKDGCLVGIHQEAINALRERLQHAIIVKDRLTEAEKSVDAIVNGGVAQGCYALLATFKVFNKYLTALTEATTSTFKWAAYFWQSQGLA